MSTTNQIEARYTVWPTRAALAQLILPDVALHVCRRNSRNPEMVRVTWSSETGSKTKEVHESFLQNSREEDSKPILSSAQIERLKSLAKDSFDRDFDLAPQGFSRLVLFVESLIRSAK